MIEINKEAYQKLISEDRMKKENYTEKYYNKICG